MVQVARGRRVVERASDIAQRLLTAGAVGVLDRPFKPATLAPGVHGFIAAGLGRPSIPT